MLRTVARDHSSGSNNEIEVFNVSGVNDTGPYASGNVCISLNKVTNTLAVPGLLNHRAQNRPSSRLPLCFLIVLTK